MPVMRVYIFAVTITIHPTLAWSTDGRHLRNIGNGMYTQKYTYGFLKALAVLPTTQYAVSNDGC